MPIYDLQLGSFHLTKPVIEFGGDQPIYLRMPNTSTAFDESTCMRDSLAAFRSFYADNTTVSQSPANIAH